MPLSMQHMQHMQHMQVPQDSPSLKATAREFSPKFDPSEMGYYDAMGGMDVGMGMDMEAMMAMAMQQYGVLDVAALEAIALNVGMTLPAFLQANYMAAAQYGVYNTGGYDNGYAAYGVVDPNMQHYMQPDGGVQYVDPSYYSMVGHIDMDSYAIQHQQQHQQQQQQQQQQQPQQPQQLQHLQQHQSL
jgi:hypothetical protein